jgi:formamidopyrimidine-DNA glycosylase
MPELPEVETTRAGLEPLLQGEVIESVSIRDGRLRWPVPPDLPTLMAGAVIHGVFRRAKYLLWGTATGTCMVHLGMSGSVRVVPHADDYHKHDHVAWRLTNGREVRLRDPRRFGSVHWIEGELDDHPLLRHLGPEPLGNQFDGRWLFDRSRKKSVAVKNFIMDAKQVVGVGNIYASEALHRSGIHPSREAGRVSAARYETLASDIRKVLQAAIVAGGTTLRDFANNDGEPGYFAQRLLVYGRDGQPCETCGKKISRLVIGQRSSFFCTRCQR